MKDPTKPMRKMYVQGLSTILTLYDGMAPIDAGGTYGVIMSTSFIREGIKSVNSSRFNVTVNIYQEFENDGNSEGVDDICDAMIETLVPLDRSGYLVIEGFNQHEVRVESISNTAFQNDALVIFQKTIVLNHFISEN